MLKPATLQDQLMMHGTLFLYELQVYWSFGLSKNEGSEKFIISAPMVTMEAPTLPRRYLSF